MRAISKKIRGTNNSSDMLDYQENCTERHFKELLKTEENLDLQRQLSEK